MMQYLITKKENAGLEKQVISLIRKNKSMITPHIMAKSLLVFFLALFTTQIFAQSDDDYEVIDYTSTEDYYIQDIKVTGVKYLDKEILSNLSGLRVGQRITIPG
jgi:outer membrane protein assembly factor BamA